MLFRSAVRYILYREIPFGSDGNYSTEVFLTRVNSDLSNNFGNLVSRTFGMMNKYFGGVVPATEKSENEDDIMFEKNVLAKAEEVKSLMTKYEITKAVSAVFDIFTEANTYIQKVQPWVLAKEEDKTRLASVMKNLLEAIRIGTELFSPFAPESTSKVLVALNKNPDAEFDNLDNFNGIEEGLTLGKLDILFPRLDIEKETQELKEIANAQN